MLRLLLASTVGIAAAVLLGYAGAAAMATELGRVSLAVLGVLIALAWIAQSAGLLNPLNRPQHNLHR